MSGNPLLHPDDSLFRQALILSGEIYVQLVDDRVVVMWRKPGRHRWYRAEGASPAEALSRLLERTRRQEPGGDDAGDGGSEER